MYINVNDFTIMVGGGYPKAKARFTLEQATMAQWGKYRYSSTLSLTSALDGIGWSKPRSGRFTHGKETVSIV
jgi:hypothetical protein